MNGSGAPYALLMAGQLSERAGMASSLSGGEAFRRLAPGFDDLTSGHFSRWVTTADQDELSGRFVAPSAMVLYDILCGQSAADAWGPPSAVSGYSLGFYAAAVLAGVTRTADILGWLQRVDETNRRTFPPGQYALAAVTGLSVPEMEATLAEAGLSEVCVANINNARQLVIGGPHREVARAEERLREVALDLRRLPLDIPLHTRHLEPARREVESWWASVAVRDPVVPLISPVDGTVLEGGAEFKRHMLASLVAPTHWQAVIARLQAMEIPRALDTSPRGELGRMARWTYRSLHILPVESLWGGAPDG